MVFADAFLSSSYLLRRVVISVSTVIFLGRRSVLLTPSRFTSLIRSRKKAAASSRFVQRVLLHSLSPRTFRTYHHTLPRRHSDPVPFFRRFLFAIAYLFGFLRSVVESSCRGQRDPSGRGWHMSTRCLAPPP